MNLVFGVKDKPKFSQMLIFAFQQVLAILAALALLAGLSGLAWVFLILPYEAGISAFLKALRALGRAVIDLINRFFLFLASILPAFPFYDHRHQEATNHHSL